MESRSTKGDLHGVQTGCRTRRTPIIIFDEKIKHTIPRGCLYINFGAAMDRMEGAQGDNDVGTFSKENDLSE